MDSLLLNWLRDETRDWRPSIVGVFREHAAHSGWPLTAQSPGDGEFATADEFYAYWRAPSVGWKRSPEAERLLRQALDAQDS